MKTNELSQQEMQATNGGMSMMPYPTDDQNQTYAAPTLQDDGNTPSAPDGMTVSPVSDGMDDGSNHYIK